VVCGGPPPASVREFAGPSVELRGFVVDLDQVYQAARVVISPMRYGAGVKHKTMEALEYGVPTVATSIGAEGIELRGVNDAVIVCDDAQSFAGAVIELLTSASAWDHRRAAIETLHQRWREQPTASWTDLVDHACSHRVWPPGIEGLA
jgi:glycosyltransferase involved in cell wall biosynthesis